MSATETTTIEQYREWFPVGQEFHTGRYGWRRVAGCLNLNACRFRSREEAERDRDAHYAAFLREPFSR